MSDEYTPTTERVRFAYLDRSDFEDQVAGVPWRGDEAANAEFDRWLAAHDAEVRAEAATIRRLHEEATERTVQLAAVIEKARAVFERPGPGNAADDVDEMHRVLSWETPSAVLRERDAAKWDEGALWAAVECGAIPDEGDRAFWLAPGDNPYRPANSEQSPPYSDIPPVSVASTDADITYEETNG